MFETSGSDFNQSACRDVAYLMRRIVGFACALNNDHPPREKCLTDQDKMPPETPSSTGSNPDATDDNQAEVQGKQG